MDVFWTLSQIAERDGISSVAVGKAARRFVEVAGLPVRRDARGRIATVSVAHFDHCRERFQNPARRWSAPPPIDSSAGDEPPSFAGGPTSSLLRGDSFEEARRQNEWLKLGRERLRLQEDAGQLVRADKLGEAVGLAGRAIQAIVARLPNRADDISQIVAKEGAHGLRLKLRDIAFDLNTSLADALAEIAATSPAHDPPIDEPPLPPSPQKDQT